ncbi:ImmA/IrrE family metallo-endopeptidase [Salinicoccus sesuvii]|uniref:ImmA/IrrE family metallo-endopeptidase n=1 Tax=Salinicoccus sesuvii TaxID=868281 RepID=A0ABV7N5I4_9STAP
MISLETPLHIITAESLARKLIKRDELDVKFFKASNYFKEIFDHFDCEVINFPMNTRISGMTQKDELGLSVMINPKIPTGMINFTYAHEIAHIVLHIDNGIKPEIDTSKTTSFKSRNKIEVEANQFAAQFLIPDIALKNQVLSGYTLYNIKYYSNVSVDVIKWRLINVLKKEHGLHNDDAIIVFNNYKDCRTHDEVRRSELREAMHALKV